MHRGREEWLALARFLNETVPTDIGMVRLMPANGLVKTCSLRLERAVAVCCDDRLFWGAERGRGGRRAQVASEAGENEHTRKKAGADHYGVSYQL